jgi:hypothetical protein
MRKLALWTTIGLGMALACSLTGMTHLSATIITLTTFMSGQFFIVIGIEAFERRRSRQS